MIKLEHTVTASPEQMIFVIEGMRNPMNSWDVKLGGVYYKYHICHDICAE